MVAINEIIVDVSPKQTEHRYRGIGRYVTEVENALRDAQTRIPIRFLGLRTRDEVLPPDTISYWRPTRPRYHLDWMYNEIFLRRTLVGLRPSIYLSHDPSSCVISDRFRTVATVYDLIPLRLKEQLFDNYSLDQKVGYRRYLQSIRKCHHIITISNASKEDIVNYLAVDRDKVTVIYPGLSQLKTSGNGRTMVDNPISGDIRYLLYVGSAEPHKQVPVLIKAFSAVRRAFGDLQLVLVGKWSEQQMSSVMSQVSPQDAANIRVLGHVTNEVLEALYIGAAMFVFPSIIEGFGLPIVEAMSYGTPVICADTGLNREIADGSALLFDAGSEEDLSQKIITLLTTSGLRERLMEAGKKRAMTFSWGRSASNITALFECLLGGGET